jgi:TRAP-type C4-dicarboxylate transport system permease small subunit
MDIRKLGSTLDRPLAGLERIGVLLGCALLWGMLGLVLLQVFSRVIFRMGLPWPEELARYFHIVMVFVGLAFAHRLRSHVNVAYFTERMSPKAQRIIGIAIELCIVVASSIVVAGGLLLMTSRMGAQRSPSLGMPLMLFISATVGGFLLLGLEAFRQLLRILARYDDVAPSENRDNPKV